MVARFDRLVRISSLWPIYPVALGPVLPPSATTDCSSMRLLYSDTCRKPYARNSAKGDEWVLSYLVRCEAYIGHRPIAPT